MYKGDKRVKKKKRSDLPFIFHIDTFAEKKKTPAQGAILISPCFHSTFRPPPSHVKVRKIEKGRQCNGDKRVKKGKKTDLPFISYITLSTVFMNPDIYIYKYNHYKCI